MRAIKGETLLPRINLTEEKTNYLRVGIVLSPQDTWHFFNEIYNDLKSHYEVDVFQFDFIKSPIFYDRLNRSMFHRKLKSFLRNHDVVFFEWASEWLAYATKYPQECQIVTRLHRYEMYQWVDKIDWERVDKIILVSNVMLHKFSELFPEHSHKTVVIPAGVSVNKFQFKEKKFNGNIGILGHLTPRKRVYDLILTFYELAQKRNDLRLHIAGEARPSHLDYYEALYHITKRLNLQENILFHGYVNDTWNWYPEMDIFISNSYSEGLQVALMEAMASGCYCLSHHWSGADELLPTENLYYTNKEMAEKILNYCDGSDTEKQLQRERMRTLVYEKFDIEQTKQNIREIINNMANNFNQ